MEVFFLHPFMCRCGFVFFVLLLLVFFTDFGLSCVLFHCVRTYIYMADHQFRISERKMVAACDLSEDNTTVVSRPATTSVTTNTWVQSASARARGRSGR